MGPDMVGRARLGHDTGGVLWYGTLEDFDRKVGIVTVCIASANFHSFNVSSYHQMLLDPLNVGLSKKCEENLVIAFSWVFFLSTMNMTSFSVCKLALGALGSSTNTRKYNTCISYF